MDLSSFWQGFAAGCFIFACAVVIVAATTLAFIRRQRPRRAERRYFVPYAGVTNSGLGFGWVDITRDQPIRDGEDINGIAATIRENDEELTSAIPLGAWPFESR